MQTNCERARFRLTRRKQVSSLTFTTTNKVIGRIMKINKSQIYSELRSPSKASQSGWLLAEGMVAIGVGLMLLVAIVGIFVDCSISFAAISNYVSMDSKSRNALDHMTTNIRRSKALTSYDPAALVFNYDTAGATNLAYRYNSS